MDVFVVKIFLLTADERELRPQRFKEWMGGMVAMKRQAQRLYETAAKKAGKAADKLQYPRRLVAGR